MQKQAALRLPWPDHGARVEGSRLLLTHCRRPQFAVSKHDGSGLLGHKSCAMCAVACLQLGRTCARLLPSCCAQSNMQVQSPQAPRREGAPAASASAMRVRSRDVQLRGLLSSNSDALELGMTAIGTRCASRAVGVGTGIRLLCRARRAMGLPAGCSGGSGCWACACMRIKISYRCFSPRLNLTE